MARNRRAKVSHRPQSEAEADGGDADWNLEEKSWSHTRYLHVTLAPAGPSTRFTLDREEYQADWVAVYPHSSPEVADGDRLVTLDASGNDDLVLEVEKVVPHGRKQVIYLEEKARVQP